MKYRGIIKNRLSGEVRKTRYYPTYERAHHQAESLGIRVYRRNDNWEIDVITIIEEEEE